MCHYFQIFLLDAIFFGKFIKNEKNKKASSFLEAFFVAGTVPNPRWKQ